MNHPDPEIAAVLIAYAAYARGNIDQAIAGLHPHVEWIEPEQFPYGGRRVGPAALADHLRNSRSSWAELVSEPTATRRGNDIVVVHHAHGRLADGPDRPVSGPAKTYLSRPNRDFLRCVKEGLTARVNDGRRIAGRKARPGSRAGRS